MKRRISDGVVIVEASLIQSVRSGLPIPEGATVVDLGDSTLLPGLIDSHTHLTGQASDDWLQDTVDCLRRGVPELAIRSAKFARKTLLAGFTTVRNVGSNGFPYLVKICATGGVLSLADEVDTPRRCSRQSAGRHPRHREGVIRHGGENG